MSNCYFKVLPGKVWFYFNYEPLPVFTMVYRGYSINLRVSRFRLWPLSKVNLMPRLDQDFIRSFLKQARIFPIRVHHIPSFNNIEQRYFVNIQSGGASFCV